MNKNSEPNFDIRPTTKYSLFRLWIDNLRQKTEYETYKLSKKHFYNCIEGAPPSGYFNNVDLESNYAINILLYKKVQVKVCMYLLQKVICTKLKYPILLLNSLTLTYLIKINFATRIT